MIDNKAIKTKEFAQWVAWVTLRVTGDRCEVVRRGDHSYIVIRYDYSGKETEI